MLLRMRYGFYSPNFGGTGDPRFVAELGARAEAAGWDGFFLWDHLAVQPAPLVDPWVALAAVAARTERIVLGPLIVPLARRRPQKVALEAVSLARLAAGRFVLGVGLGAPDDYTRFGEDADWRTRAAKLDDGLALVRRLAAAENVGEPRPAGSLSRRARRVPGVGERRLAAATPCAWHRARGRRLSDGAR